MKVLKVNAFSNSKKGGNPAGVVLTSPQLTETQMKQISKELEVSETAFVFPSNIADYKLRFFSPEVEVELCGHATIATFFALAEKDFLDTNQPTVTLDQETKVGILPVDIYCSNGHCEKVMMTQQRPILKGVRINFQKLATSLNTDMADIDGSLPQQIVSTGLFTLPVCIKSFEILQHLNPHFDKIKEICRTHHVGSLFPFTFDTLEEQSTYHARCFAPLYGINEDPVTGTANGAVSCYLVKNKILKETKLLCEQGDIMGRPGRVIVEVDTTVKVGGIATIVEEQDLEV